MDIRVIETMWQSLPSLFEIFTIKFLSKFKINMIIQNRMRPILKFIEFSRFNNTHH
jgi:hypothetical protein